jgi:hypothetical protein
MRIREDGHPHGSSSVNNMTFYTWFRLFAFTLAQRIT